MNARSVTIPVFGKRIALGPDTTKKVTSSYGRRGSARGIRGIGELVPSEMESPKYFGDHCVQP